MDNWRQRLINKSSKLVNVDGQNLEDYIPISLNFKRTVFNKNDPWIQSLLKLGIELKKGGNYGT